MLWALASSAYVLYLYRTLKSGAEPPRTALPGASGDLSTALDTLDRRLASIEARLDGTPSKEPVR